MSQEEFDRVARIQDLEKRVRRLETTMLAKRQKEEKRIQFSATEHEQYDTVGTSPGKPRANVVGEFVDGIRKSFLDLRQSNPVSEVKEHMRAKLNRLKDEAPSLLRVLTVVITDDGKRKTKTNMFQRTQDEINADRRFIEQLMRQLKG